MCVPTTKARGSRRISDRTAGWKRVHGEGNVGSDQYRTVENEERALNWSFDVMVRLAIYKKSRRADWVKVGAKTSLPFETSCKSA